MYFTLGAGIARPFASVRSSAKRAIFVVSAEESRLLDV
jgi:hypothetical protein